MHPTRSFTFSCLSLLVLVAVSGYAFAGSTAVGLCAAPGTHYSTIQAAVTAAEVLTGPNTVRICPGTYHEQVVINNPSSTLFTLIGVKSTAPPPTQNAAVILPPVGGLVANAYDFDRADPVGAQIFVQNATGPVTINNLTVDGKGNGLGCDTDVQGILYQNSSGTVNHVAVRNQVPSDTPSGCQVGRSIYVQTSAGTSNVTVENSSVHNYNKNGIQARDAGTTLTAIGNNVEGNGVVPSGGAAQNGIEIITGATGSIKTNTVIDNVYGDTSLATSSDILLFDAANGITVSGNTLGNSNIPIGLIKVSAGLDDNVTVTANKISGPSTIDGIDACSKTNTIQGNKISTSSESAVHLDSSCGGSTGNTVTGNTILESDCAGVLDDAGSNTTSPNTYYTVPFPVATSTAGCPFVTGPTRAQTTHKFKP